MKPRPKTLAPRLLTEERRRKIAGLVTQHGRATVEELAMRFGVSTVTIRGDLETLARGGALVRSHGGAIPVDDGGPVQDAPLSIKATQHQPEKVRIAKAAAQLIRSGETIILDSGTTTAEIARQILRLKLESLTVITNALNIALELSGPAHIRVLMLGGLLRPMSYSLVGPHAEQALAGLTADKLFLGVDGLDPEVGVTTPEPLEAELNALMIRVSREVIAVADASKFGRRSLSVIAPARSLHRLITDGAAPPEMLDAFRAQGVDVMLA